MRYVRSRPWLNARFLSSRHVGRPRARLLQLCAPVGDGEGGRAARALGQDTAREIAPASAAGAVSSSCSYAFAAIMRTLFKKGAALTCALAFMVASTNLVLELGLVLLVLLGWKFMLGQWIGGAVMIAILSLVVKLTAPKGFVDAARGHDETGGAHDHGASMVVGDTWWARVMTPKTRIVLAQSFAMEWSMLWKDLLIGFVVGGLITAIVPNDV